MNERIGDGAAAAAHREVRGRDPERAANSLLVKMGRDEHLVHAEAVHVYHLEAVPRRLDEVALLGHPAKVRHHKTAESAEFTRILALHGVGSERFPGQGGAGPQDLSSQMTMLPKGSYPFK